LSLRLRPPRSLGLQESLQESLQVAQSFLPLEQQLLRALVQQVLRSVLSFLLS
jgi:hypothetical protein